jgi:tetratricopeptide (TPR) repeat protein
LEVRASFLALVVLIGLPTHLDAWSLLTWIALSTLGVLIHEAGHALAFAALGDRPSIVLHGGGGHTVGGHHGARQMVVVYAAGPGAGLLLGLVVLGVEQFGPGAASQAALIQDAKLVTIGLSLLNLIPLGVLDGNAALQSLVAAATGRPAGALGWTIGAMAMLALILLTAWLGMTDVALMLVIVAALQWRTLEGFMGRQMVQGAAGALIAGRWSDALARAESDLRRRPADTGAHLIRASALLAMTRYGEAEAAYDELLAREPDRPRALAGRSGARRAQGRTADADQDLETLLEGEPRDTDDVRARFLGLYLGHRYHEALELIRVRLTGEGITPPEADQLRVLEALLLSVLGQAEVALDRVDALLARHPEDFATHELRALTLLQLGRVEEAAGSIRRALAGAPRHPELLETRGVVERLAGDVERAYASLLESAAARPDLPRALAELAACLVQLGRPDDARHTLDRLPAFAHADPFVRYARAAVLAADGRLDEAREALGAAASIRPSLGRIAGVDPILRGLGRPEATTPWSAPAVMPGVARSGTW